MVQGVWCEWCSQWVPPGTAHLHMPEKRHDMKQGTLFQMGWPEYPKARKTDPETSHEAAASVRGLRESQHTILRLLEVFGPMTDEEILGRVYANGGGRMSPSGARTRRAELVAMGLVRDSGRRSKTKAGRNTIVWEKAR